MRDLEAMSPWHTDHEPPPVAVSVNEAYLHELQADAARWRYVRANMMRSDPKMDGTSYFFFRNPLGRGKTPNEVVDRLIEESQREGK